MKLVEETTIDESVKRLNDFMESQKEAIEKEKFLTDSLGMQVTDYVKHSGHFSFSVPTELEAYKAAYKHKYQSNAVVLASPRQGNWRVNIYPD